LNATYTVSSGAFTAVTTGYDNVLSACTNSAMNGTTSSTTNIGSFSCDFNIIDDKVMVLRNCTAFQGQTFSATFFASIAFLDRVH
jgi:hypothetical protein